MSGFTSPGASSTTKSKHGRVNPRTPKKQSRSPFSDGQRDPLRHASSKIPSKRGISGRTIKHKFHS